VPRSSHQLRITPSLLDRLLDSTRQPSHEVARPKTGSCEDAPAGLPQDVEREWRVVDFQAAPMRAGPHADSLEGLKSAVRRDLDALLNTRNTFFDLSPEFSEIGRSVLTFGLPDFTEFGHGTPRDHHARLRQAVEDAIRKFEPRLTGLSVTIVDTAPSVQSLHLRVEAHLAAALSRDRVAFDVILPQHSRTYEVRARE